MKTLKELREKIDEADRSLFASVGELMSWLRTQDYRKKKGWPPDQALLENALISACVSHGYSKNKELEPNFVTAVVATIINYCAKHDLDLVAAAQIGNPGLPHLFKVINVIARRLDLALDVERAKRHENGKLFNRQRETEVVNAALMHADKPAKGAPLDKSFAVALMSMVIDFCTKKEVEQRENA